MWFPPWLREWWSTKRHTAQTRSSARTFSTSWIVSIWAGYPSGCCSTSTVSRFSSLSSSLCVHHWSLLLLNNEPDYFNQTTDIFSQLLIVSDPFIWLWGGAFIEYFSLFLCEFVVPALRFPSSSHLWWEGEPSASQADRRYRPTLSRQRRGPRLETSCHHTHYIIYFFKWFILELTFLLADAFENARNLCDRYYMNSPELVLEEFNGDLEWMHL